MESKLSQTSRPGHTGFYFDDLDAGSAWIREEATLRLPKLREPLTLIIRGRFLDIPKLNRLERGPPSLTVGASGGTAHLITRVASGQNWALTLPLTQQQANAGAELRFFAEGVSLANTLAWLGRVTGLPSLQLFRKQRLNRQLRITRIETNTGLLVCDFSKKGSALSPEFLQSLVKLGVNVVGWLDREIGLGESARCMLRAATAAQLATSPIQLKVPCKARGGNKEFPTAAEQHAPHGVNIFHIDPPASVEIDRRHGKTLRAGRRNIAYWAWELGEFPDSWVPSFKFFDEIWCPSDFVRESVAQKSPIPVLTMPHAISITTPSGEGKVRFALPTDSFLFLFVYDLNSYTARKNPQAVLEAFQLAKMPQEQARLIIKVHGVQGNEAALTNLRAQVAKVEGTLLLEETLSRTDLMLLFAACDCFVSLHRAEGFGLAVAEAMALGKPVIATDWSATSEYLNEHNGCPVRYKLERIEQNEGPYPKGGIWAEPDLAHAAEWMNRLVCDRGLATQLGAAAKRTIQERFSPEQIGLRYRKRLDAFALFE